VDRKVSVKSYFVYSVPAFDSHDSCVIRDFNFPGAINEGTIKYNVLRSGRRVPTFREILLFLS
jgi:hypothetical protein